MSESFVIPPTKAKTTEDLGHGQRLIVSEKPVERIYGCLYWGDGQGKAGVTDPFEMLPGSFQRPDGKLFRGFYSEEQGIGIDVQSDPGEVFYAFKPKDPLVDFSVYVSPNRADVTLFISGFMSGLHFVYARIRAAEQAAAAAAEAAPPEAG